MENKKLPAKPKPGRCARKGKIARLPAAIRRQLNLRLQNGEKAVRLVPWLNQLPEVKAVIDAEFQGVPVSQSNVSEWKQGGYRDWEAGQTALDKIQSFIQKTDAIAKDFPEGLIERMVLFLKAQMAARLDDLDAAGNTAAHSDDLGEFLTCLTRLRRGDFHAQRLAIDRERLELLRKKTRQEFEDECWKWAAQPEVREQICRGQCYTEEEKRRRAHQILEITPPDEKKPGEQTDTKKS